MNVKTKVSILVSVLVLPLLIFSPQMVQADHTIEHCISQTGSDNNESYDNCVRDIPETLGEWSQYCTARTGSDNNADYRDCMSENAGGESGQNVQPDSPENLCPDPGTSSYVSCINAIEDLYDECEANFPAGSDRGQCYRDSVDQYFEPTTTTSGPGGSTGDGDVSFNATTPNEPLCGGDGNPCAPPPNIDVDECGDATNAESTNILCQLVRIVNFLSIGVAVVSAITVAVAGMQYTASRGDPGKTSAAINRLTQVGLAIVMYVFGLALLNWIIPGGAL